MKEVHDLYERGQIQLAWQYPLCLLFWIVLCFVVKSNQTSLYDTILNPVHTWKFIITVFEIYSIFPLFQLNSSCSVRPLGDLLLHLCPSSALPVTGTHRKTQMSPGVLLSSLCPSSCILSLCSLQRGACVLMWILLTACYSGSLGLVCNPVQIPCCFALSSRCVFLMFADCQ